MPLGRHLSRHERTDAVRQGTALASQVARDISWQMQVQNVAHAELAHRMGVTPGRVSQILSGDANLTLRTLAAVAEALNTRVVLVFGDGEAEEGHTVQIVDVSAAQQRPARSERAPSPAH